MEPAFDTFSVRQGVYTVKRSYFYGITQSGEVSANRVKELIPSANIVEFGNHFARFRGGAKTGGPQSSYYWVKFTV